MITIHLNIGSNKGDRHDNLRRAVAAIESAPWARAADRAADVRVRCSTVVETAPWGYESASPYLNMGVAVDLADALTVEPERVLDITQQIERGINISAHRDAEGRYQDRELDVDIIAIDTAPDTTMHYRSARLVLPHPRASQRDFVMGPLRSLRTATIGDSKA